VSSEVICPRCGRKHTVPFLYVGENTCPNSGRRYYSDELEMVRSEQKALYRPKQKAKRGATA